MKVCRKSFRNQVVQGSVLHDVAQREPVQGAMCNNILWTHSQSTLLQRAPCTTWFAKAGQNLVQVRKHSTETGPVCSKLDRVWSNVAKHSAYALSTQDMVFVHAWETSTPTLSNLDIETGTTPGDHRGTTGTPWGHHGDNPRTPPTRHHRETTKTPPGDHGTHWGITKTP